MREYREEIQQKAALHSSKSPVEIPNPSTRAVNNHPPTSWLQPHPQTATQSQTSNSSTSRIFQTATSQVSGLPSAGSSAVKMKEEFNLEEILNFVSSSWDKALHTSHVSTYPFDQPSRFPDPHLQSAPIPPPVGPPQLPNYPPPPHGGRPGHQTKVYIFPYGSYTTQAESSLPQVVTTPVYPYVHPYVHPFGGQAAQEEPISARAPDTRCSIDLGYFTEKLLRKVAKIDIAGLVEGLGSASPPVAFARRMSQRIGRCSCLIR